MCVCLVYSVSFEYIFLESYSATTDLELLRKELSGHYFNAVVLKIIGLFLSCVWFTAFIFLSLAAL